MVGVPMYQVFDRAAPTHRLSLSTQRRRACGYPWRIGRILSLPQHGRVQVVPVHATSRDTPMRSHHTR
eukprot:scaffold1652_cov394-Prasinococcus_capsulatus_cf.AAC.7